jgi:hypothetical protein
VINNKNYVYKAYEKIADWYDEHRSRDLFEKTWLDKAIALLPKNPYVLDLESRRVAISMDHKGRCFDNILVERGCGEH